jgi:hypothetical protein
MDKSEKNRRINCKRNNQNHRAKIRKINADQSLLWFEKKNRVIEHERNLKY